MRPDLLSPAAVPTLIVDSSGAVLHVVRRVGGEEPPLSRPVSRSSRVLRIHEKASRCGGGGPPSVFVLALCSNRHRRGGGGTAGAGGGAARLGVAGDLGFIHVVVAPRVRDHNTILCDAIL